MVTFRSITIFMVLAAFLSLGVACSSNEAPNKLGSAAKDSQPAAENKDEQPVAAGEEKLPGVAPKETAQETAPAAGEPKEMAQEEAPAAPPKTLALTGTVQKAGEDMVLSTDLGDYIIAGQDLSQMVGKTVNVTGAVEEADGKFTINVESFTEE